MGDKKKEWDELGERLRVASPSHFERALELVRKIVDARESLAEYDGQLMLRPKRTLKRYTA